MKRALIFASLCFLWWHAASAHRTVAPDSVNIPDHTAVPDSATTSDRAVVPDSAVDAVSRAGWEDAFQAWVDDDLSEEVLEQMYELLSERAEQPLNLNACTPDELLSLPFLSEGQVEDIMAYVYLHGPVRTLGELFLVPSLDFQTRRLLSFFVYAGPVEKKTFPSLRQVSKYGRHSLTFSSSLPLYRRKGDVNGYLGPAVSHSFRYSFNYSDRVRFGLVGSQSAGEPFFGSNKWGYDHYSYYLFVQRLGFVKALALGTYRLSFGMGLVANSQFSFGKQLLLSSARRDAQFVKPHSSRSSDGYYNGVAATLALGRQLQFTFFASHRKVDGTLRTDGNVSSIVTGGYHRTPTEFSKKGNTTEVDGGAHIHFTGGRFHLGATALYTWLDRKLSPNTASDYRRYYPSGSRFFNASLDYGYSSRLLTVQGETAIDRHHALATVNSVRVDWGGAWQLSAVQRFYSYRYTALHASSFSENGRVQNESGVCLRAVWRPDRLWQLNAYIDYFYFPWKRYLASAPGDGYDLLSQLTYSPGDNVFFFRYRQKSKDRDSHVVDGVRRQVQHRFRLSADIRISPQWRSKSVADLTVVAHDSTSAGWMLSQSVTWQPLRPLQLTLGAAYFHTDNYATRIYASERNLLYAFSFPSFYGRGVRLSFFGRCALSRSLLFIARVGHTRYFDREVIGSGLQQINSKRKTDVDLQLRCTF